MKIPFTRKDLALFLMASGQSPRVRLEQPLGHYDWVSLAGEHFNATNERADQLVT